ncbi:unnamed protein product [Orchesella dallaii]|uniref:Uncharacterized protein n=1 Tax=Orchesella dallaii TaxID=48710 RepID=A0ABP1PTA8_9HEXA
MDNHPHRHQLTPLPLAPTRRTQHQQNLTQLQQQGSIPQNPQLPLHPVQFQFTDVFNSRTSNTTSVHAQEFANTTTTTPLGTPRPPRNRGLYDVSTVSGLNFNAVADIEKSNEELWQQNESVQKTITKLQVEHENLSKQNRGLSNEVCSLNERLITEGNNYQRKEKEWNEEKAKVKSYQEKVKSLESELAGSENSYAVLCENFEKCSRDAASNAHSLNSQLKSSETNNRSLSTEVKKLKLERAQQEEEKQVRITKHKEEVCDLECKAQQATIQFRVSSGLVKSLKAELEALKTTSSNKIKILKEELENERAQKANKETRLDHPNEIEKLTRDLNEERAKCANKSEAIASLRKITGNLEVESKKVVPLVNQVEALKREKDSLSGQLDESREDNQKLEGTIQTLNAQVNELRTSNEEFLGQLINHRYAIENLEKKVVENNALIDDKEQQIKEQKLDVDSLQTSLQICRDQICKMEKDAEEEVKAHNAALGKEERRASFYSTNFKREYTTRTNLERELKKYQKENDDYEEQIEDLKQKAKSLTINLDWLSQSLHEEKSELQGSRKEVEKKFKKVKSALKEKEIEADKSQFCIIELCSQLGRVEKKLEHAKMHLADSSESFMQCVNCPLNDADKIPEISIAIVSTLKKKTLTSNHDGTVGSINEPSKKRRSDDSNGTPDVTERSEKHGRFSALILSHEKIVEDYAKDLHDGIV